MSLGCMSGNTSFNRSCWEVSYEVHVVTTKMQLDVEVSPPAFYCIIWSCGFPHVQCAKCEESHAPSDNHADRQDWYIF